MAKIGEIWAKLTLKTADFTKGLKAAEKASRSFSGIMAQMGKGAAGVFTAIGTAAMAMFNNLIKNTQTFGDFFARKISGVKSRWQNFTSNLGSWLVDKDKRKMLLLNPKLAVESILFSGENKMAGAAGEAKANALDALFEVENAFKIATTEMGPRLNELYLKMMNTALSSKDRKAAGEEYRQLLEPIYEKRAAAYKDIMDATVNNWAAIAGIGGRYSTSQISEMVKMMGMDQGRVEREFPDFVKAYNDRSGDPRTSEMVDAIVSYNTAANELNETLKRVDRTTMNLGASMDKIKDEDTGPTMEDTLADASASIDKYIDKVTEVEDAFDWVKDWDIEIPEIDTSAAERSIAEFLDRWREEQAEIENLNSMLKDAIVSSITDGTQAMTDGLMGLNGNGQEEILAALLMPFAKMAKQLGTMLIATGIAVKAFNTSLHNIDPVPALVAGTALVAVASAVTSGIKAMGGSGSAASAGSASSYGGGGGSDYSSRVRPEDLQTEMTIWVKGKLDGRDILISGNRASEYYGR